MKITAQEEYGLRILIRIAGCHDAAGLSIPQLSEAEGISTDAVIDEILQEIPESKS